jgi:hypothetical protein
MVEEDSTSPRLRLEWAQTIIINVNFALMS